MKSQRCVLGRLSHSDLRRAYGLSTNPYPVHRLDKVRAEPERFPPQSFVTQYFCTAGHHRRSRPRAHEGHGTRALTAISHACHREDVPRVGARRCEEIPGEGGTDRCLAELRRWPRAGSSCCQRRRAGRGGARFRRQSRADGVGGSCFFSQSDEASLRGAFNHDR